MDFINRAEIERVLANWIAQATSGHLLPSVDPAKWIAANFVKWWHANVDEVLSDADVAVRRVREELERIGGWNNPQLGEALHELVHAADAMGDLRSALGLDHGAKPDA